jgi:hypothetical protein
VRWRIWQAILYYHFLVEVLEVQVMSEVLIARMVLPRLQHTHPNHERLEIRVNVINPPSTLSQALKQ